jgi:hypothetical protein
MEPAARIASLLAVGAAALAKGALGDAAREGYAALNDLIRTRYPGVGLDRLEARPDSKARRASVEEDLSASGADRDGDLLALARRVAAALQTVSPDIAAEIGVALQAIIAGNVGGGVVKASEGQLRIGSIVTGRGNFVVRGVATGVEPAEPWPQPGLSRG